MIEDYWNENTIYLEIRTTPKSFHNSTKQEYIQTVLKAIHDAENLFPSITVMLVLSINRADTKYALSILSSLVGKVHWKQFSWQ